jgi:hypothetical protein
MGAKIKVIAHNPQQDFMTTTLQRTKRVIPEAGTIALNPIVQSVASRR